MSRTENMIHEPMASMSESERIAGRVHSVFTQHGFKNSCTDAMPLDPHLYKLVLVDSTILVHVHCVEFGEMVIAHARSADDGKIHRLLIQTLPRSRKKGPCPLISRIETRLLFMVCPAARPGTHVGDPSELPPPLLQSVLQGLDKASLRAFAINRALVEPCRAEHKLRPPTPRTGRMVYSTLDFDPYAFETRMYSPPWAAYARSWNTPFALFDPSLPLVPDGLPEYSTLRTRPPSRWQTFIESPNRRPHFELDDDSPTFPSTLGTWHSFI